MVAPSGRCSRSMTRASLLPARGARVLACSSMVRTGGFGPIRNRPRFRLRFPFWRDRLFRSVVDGDGLQPGRRQFERVALSSVVSAPDRHPRLGSNLSDQAELRKLFADFGENSASHLVGRGQANVLALRSGAQHDKLRIGQFDAHDPTLSLILDARTIQAPHQDEPRIGHQPKGRLGQALIARRLTTTPMLPFEGKASRFWRGRFGFIPAAHSSG